MKIEHKAVIEVFDQLLALVDAIIETAKVGDDGYLESMEDQKEEMSKIVLAFRAEHLTKEETQFIAGKYDFVKEAERIINNGQHEGNGQMNSNEVMSFVKYQCYNYLKKTLRERPVDLEMDEFEVRNYIDCLSFEWPKFKSYEKAFSQTIFNVVLLVTQEVMEYRRKNQQLTLL
jgi:2C-methyl-D-erythritol 2,4-cyclodiphosphate synthase